MDVRNNIDNQVWNVTSKTSYTCCIYSTALQTNFIMGANTMNPNQTVPTGAIDQGLSVGFFQL